MCSLKIEEYKNGFLLPFLQHNQDDTFYMRFQIPHGWNFGEIRPHIHLIPCAELGLNVTRSIDLGYQVGWVHKESLWPITWQTGSLIYQISGSMFDMHKFVVLCTVNNDLNSNHSDILLMKIVRSGSSSPNDTYTESKSGGTLAANVALLYADLHLKINKNGTLNELFGP